MYKVPDEQFIEPRNILKYTTEAYCEMTLQEHNFLCSLIRKRMPNKVLEVGVAGGGTTAVIMKCLDLVNPLALMYSVDLSEECYRRKGKQTGYQLFEVKDNLSNYCNHNFLLGHILPDRIKEIGKNIDFVILDTTHLMPGEILDFLTVLPYLSKDAIVVLHDVALNLSGRGGYSYATKILLDAVSGEKYYDYQKALNISAFRITEETKVNIANVFSALSITWQYKPSLSELMSYRDIFRENYDKECIDLFDIFVGQNADRIERNKGEKIAENNRISTISKIKEKFMKCRVDIKNRSAEEIENNDLVIENVLKNDLDISSPQWFNKKGKGYLVQSKEGFLKIKCTITGDGILEIALRGEDYRVNEKKIPIYITYTSFNVNGKDLILEPICVWHDEPYIYQIPVKNNEVYTISISWKEEKNMNGNMIGNM